MTETEEFMDIKNTINTNRLSPRDTSATKNQLVLKQGHTDRLQATNYSSGQMG